jgi:hypothetical protein
VEERIQKELKLLRRHWPNLEYRPDCRWVRIPSYRLPEGWSLTRTEAAFQIPIGYPETPPYGICVPAGLTIRGLRPNNYAEPASVPFPGAWGLLSWTPQSWYPTADLVTGSNLRSWVLSFADRFREGQ